MPELIDAAPYCLTFERLSGRHAHPDDLSSAAEAMGRLHLAAHTKHLHAARLNDPFKVSAQLWITDFQSPRAAVLRRVPITFDGQTTSLYKDANVRNIMMTDEGPAFVDFDDLTLAPFGYDLAKLIVSASMTYGRLSRAITTATLDSYNEALGPIHHGCTTNDLRKYAEIHHILTAPYLQRNGYRYAWPDVQPW
jgi:Ser/Thr protein kinase RdoA (MazF antagonist)